MAVQPELNNDAFKAKVEALKKDLKSPRTFVSGCNSLIALFPNNCIPMYKRQFYDSLTIIAHRFHQSGFESHLNTTREVFRMAETYKDNFTDGYRAKILEWKAQVDAHPPGVVLPSPSSAPPARNNRNNTTSADFQTFLMRAIQSVRDSSRRGSLNWGSDSSDGSSDDDAPAAVPIWPPRYAAPKKEDDIEYPYSKFTDDSALLEPQEIRHSPVPSVHDFKFQISETQYANLKKEPSLFVGLCTYKTDTKRCAESPPGIEFRVNSSNVDLKGAGHSFGVRISQMNSFETLQLKVEKESVVDEAACLTRVRDSFSTDAEVAEISRCISVKDPLSQMRINIPTRGKKCKHIQCFDLNSFLQVNKKFPKFKCPVCSNVVPYSDLIVDGLMKKILVGIKENEEADEIEMMPDGSWRVVDPEEKSKKRKNTWENVQQVTTITSP
ncbi:E3 SUMO-protein ligase PIAS4 isoform 1 [Planoprotostelium fungivorum]|uniref:E3 SUMO-protein ligase PIAS4 isoform 1 n=1 Tax=Planoprotostelium fungivorum TaxID=1890364 RepID=A0A2P6NQ07_9EUKA|nr:E3 SUMO-protein ligase PIAS4 isoform 1 [Planoprotostelium fungivorum]